MNSKATRIYVIILVFVVICLGAGILLMHEPTKTSAYVGSKAMSSTPSHSTNFQIDDAVLSIPPRLPNGVQADISITAFTGSAAEGIATYSKALAPVRFMAAKSGNRWVIVEHTKAKTLALPNITTAQKYHLPKGWYSSN